MLKLEMEDPGLQKHMSAASRKTAGHFTEKRQAKLILDIYDDILKKREATL